MRRRIVAWLFTTYAAASALPALAQEVDEATQLAALR